MVIWRQGLLDTKTNQVFQPKGQTCVWHVSCPSSVDGFSQSSCRCLLSEQNVNLKPKAFSDPDIIWHCCYLVTTSWQQAKLGRLFSVVLFSFAHASHTLHKNMRWWGGKYTGSIDDPPLDLAYWNWKLIDFWWRIKVVTHPTSNVIAICGATSSPLGPKF